jgi:hypothetical protein
MAYGKKFARVYDEKWNVWGAKMWPLTGLSFKKYDGDTFKKPGARSGRIIYVCQKEKYP